MTQIELVEELEKRLWARDPQLASACQDLLVEIKRRFECGIGWHIAFSESLDGFKELRCIPGGSVKGCAMPETIRTVVRTLIENCPKTWENHWAGEPKNGGANAQS